AKVFANEAVASGRFVPFVEEQVERLQDSIQARREFFAGRNFKRDAEFADFLLGASEAFGDSGFGREECLGNFERTETAKSFERERGLGFLRDERMTAGEHEAQAVIFDFALHQRGGIGVGIVGPLLDERDDLRLLFVKKLFAANEVEREVLGGLSEPGGGIFWNAVIGPGFQ